MSDDAAGRPRLIPMRVPWEVIPSTPYVTLTTVEGENHADVSFEAMWLAQEEEHGAARASGLIRIVFERRVAARFCPSVDDIEVIDKAAYDVSGIGVPYDPARIEEYLPRYMAKWRATGVSPDPKFYEVVPSSWAHEVMGNEPGYHHYMVVGHDAYVEVVAAEYRWEILKKFCNRTARQ